MIIDKKLNLDIPLEYAKDNSLVFASNIVTSADGTTIQNEPALVDFVNTLNINYAGHISCNEEFIIFTKQSAIYRINKNKEVKIVKNIPWKWGGGEVYGTFSYNINNELVVAISERNVGEAKVPLKIINLDRDIVNGYNKDDIYTLTPDIPKSNIINIAYIQGTKIRKGKYNFFIKYYIEDKFETAWFPIGIPIFIYDKAVTFQKKSVNKQIIEAAGKLDDKGIPLYGNQYQIEYTDYYNEENEFVNTNVQLQLDIFDTLNYTHYKIGYIVNYNGGTEGRQTTKFNIKDQSVVIGTYSELESVDNFTINAFNLYNVNTLTNYKDRLYLANYKEENPNLIISKGSSKGKIDISNIKVSYFENDAEVRTLFTQWKSKPGRAAIYNFYLHYVYPNGNYTHGIKINSLDNYKVSEVLGSYTDNDNTTKQFIITIDHTIYCQDIINKINEAERTGFVEGQAVPNFMKNEDLYNRCAGDTYAFYYQIDPTTRGGEILDDGSITLAYTYNDNGDALYQTPINKPFNTDKLIFSGIKMYPEFVGYFISYEAPEYINHGEGILVHSQTSSLGNALDNPSSNFGSDIFDFSTPAYKFYYPEFNIIGGKTNVNKLIGSGTLDLLLNNKVGEEQIVQGVETGIVLPTTGSIGYNDFNVSDKKITVSSSRVIAPDIYESVMNNNIGKEGYLELSLTDLDDLKDNADKNITQTFLAISNDTNIYLSKTKKLVSLGYIQYQKFENINMSYYYGKEKVPYNYDFYRCFSSLYAFAKPGIIINTVESNPVNATTGEDYYSKGRTFEDGTGQDYGSDPEQQGKVPVKDAHLVQLIYWHESHYPLFLKEINQGPDNIFYNYYKGTATNGIIDYAAEGTVQKHNLVLNPKYINDLYKLDPVYYKYTGKILVNYDDSLYSNFIEDYTRTIRRSDVLQSESVKTAWRYFRPENYKVITEDKGDITNVVGIGHYFFAHCEHSLFLFDINNALKTQDKDVQLLQPDTFDVAYQEVFTSEKGYGGLQDFVSWACDDFGYIFYNRDGKKIHRFDDGKLLDLSTGIDGVLNKYLPDHIYIGADRERDRILFNFRRDNNNCVLSYSTIFNNWLSTHSYITNCEFIVLKDKLIIPYFVNSTLQLKEYSADRFNSFTLPVGNVFNPGNNGESCIDVVFTDGNYNKIKVLDFITYIINKEPNDIFDTLQIEIYTNCCYSGVIDIKTERKKVSEYNKPYYDFERWNLNWFRNRIDKIENGDIIDRLSGGNKNLPEKVQRGYDNALITGKYIVIRFKFKNVYKKVDVKDIQAYFKV